MPEFTLSRVLNKKIILVARVVGLMVVAAVNIFVFLSHFNVTNFKSFIHISEFVNHATNEHNINISPFASQISLKALPGNLMQAAPVLPIHISQFIPDMLWVLVCGITLFLSSFCFFRGEENLNTQFFPSIIIPPPRPFWSLSAIIKRLSVIKYDR